MSTLSNPVPPTKNLRPWEVHAAAIVAVVCFIFVLACASASFYALYRAKQLAAATQPASANAPIYVTVEDHTPPMPTAPPAEGSTIAPDGTVTVPPGQPFEITRHRQGDYKGPELSHNETAAGVATSYDFKGQEIKGAVDQTAPASGIGPVALPGISSQASTASGSNSDSTFSLIGAPSRQVWGYIVSFIIILLGVPVWYFLGKTAGEITEAMGLLGLVVSTLMDKYPWLIVVIGLLGGGVVLVLFLQGYLHKKTAVAATATAAAATTDAANKTAAVETLVDAVDTHQQSGAPIDKAIQYETGAMGALEGTVKKIIDDAKAARGIKPPDPLIATQKALAAAQAAAPAQPAVAATATAAAATTDAAASA